MEEVQGERQSPASAFLALAGRVAKLPNRHSSRYKQTRYTFNAASSYTWLNLYFLFEYFRMIGAIEMLLKAVKEVNKRSDLLNFYSQVYIWFRYSVRGYHCETKTHWVCIG